MSTTKSIYVIHLEDYSQVRKSAAVKPYYGTMEDMKQFAVRIAEDPDASQRYHSTITALECYCPDDGGEHIMAGVQMPILTAGQIIDSNTSLLSDQKWIVHDHRGGMHSVQAEKVMVYQHLIVLDGQLIRCLKCDFEALGICFPYLGWIGVNGDCLGFPGLVSTQEGMNRMHLYMQAQVYDPKELEQALEDLSDPYSIDLGSVCYEVLGGA